MKMIRITACGAVSRTHSFGLLLVAVCGWNMLSAGRAADTGITGGGLPFQNMQPSLALNSFIMTNGIFPPPGPGGGAAAGYLGEVRFFAGSINAMPGASPEGQLLSIQQNTALFSVLGTTYGGNGTTTFALPDLRGRTILGSGQGPGLSDSVLGSSVGTATQTLSEAQMPAHDHSLPAPYNVTGPAGGNQPFNNMQPSLPLTYLVAMDGIYPGAGVISGLTPFLGQVKPFAGNFAPSGWHDADGALLSIAQNTALFSLLGTTYGGDGTTTFALPDLRGRTAIDSGQGPGLTNRNPGDQPGVENVTLNALQLPAHDHTAPVPGGVTGMTGGNQPFDNMLPSLALNYLINLQGIFPIQGSAVTDGYLGEVTMFAGNFAPAGTHFADGSLMLINQDPALFALLGTTYGGDGLRTFALPDLRGRALIGAGSGAPFSLGSAVGAESVALQVSQLPPHDHSIPGVPEPSSFVLLMLGLLGLATLRRVRAHV